jgi:hypothetical protein
MSDTTKYALVRKGEKQFVVDASDQNRIGK